MGEKPEEEKGMCMIVSIVWVYVTFCYGCVGNKSSGSDRRRH
jgi:hypothetical protein